MYAVRAIGSSLKVAQMIRSRDEAASAPDLRADRKRALELVPVSDEAAERLDRMVALLLQWQGRMNLIARSTVPEIWTRHIADSLQLLALAPSARVWVDLGSGGGFPGLALACALAGQKSCQVHLVESNGKKAAFLREAVSKLGVPATVHLKRIEDFVAAFDERADVVTARALAPLGKLLGLAAPLLNTGAQGLFLKGQDVEAELTDATKCWNIEATLVPSKTNPQARIVVIHSTKRAVR
jgi:16S rRNA (guanine527-N7)-methyltransferase